MGKYKLIISDMDGTLCDNYGFIAPETIRAIQGHISRGGYFTVATGRMKHGLRHAMQEVPHNAPLSCYQGGLIFDHITGEPISERYIAADVTQSLLKALIAAGYDVNLYSNDGVYVLREYDHITKYSSMNNITVVTEPDLAGFAVKNAVCAQKILICVRDTREAERLEAEFAAKFAGELNVARSAAYFIEFTAANADKGSAVKTIAARLNVDLSEVMCLGDSPNDIPMLKICGMPVAMKNAIQSVKNAAKFIAPSVDDAGAAAAILKYGL